MSEYTPTTPDQPPAETPDEAADRKVLLTVGAIIAALLLGVLLWWMLGRGEDDPQTSAPPTTTATQTVTAEPSTAVVTPTDTETTVEETTEVVEETTEVVESEAPAPPPAEEVTETVTDDAGIPAIDAENQANQAGTPGFAAANYTYLSNLISWQDDPKEWVETAKPLMSERLYNEKKALVDASDPTNEPGWEKVIEDKMTTRPSDIQAIEVSSGEGVRTIQVTFRMRTTSNNGTFTSDQDIFKQYKVIQEGDAWVVDEEQQAAN